MMESVYMNADSSIFNRKPAVFHKLLFWAGHLILLAAITAVVLHWGDWREFLKLLAQVHLNWIGAALLLQLATYACVTVIWKSVLRTCRTSISASHLFALSIAKLFSDQTVPSFGISGSAVAMRGFIRRKSPPGAAAAAVLMNTTSRYVPYFILFNLALAVVWKNHMLNRGLQYLALIFTAAVVLLILAALAAFRMSIHQKVPSWMQRIKWLRTFANTLHEIPSNVLKNGRLWMIAGAANACIFLLDASTLWVLLRALGNQADSWFHAYSAFLISSVVTDLAVVPGRIGVFEGSLITLLHLFKIPVEEAVAATVLFRGFTYWLPMVPGFVITRREFQEGRRADS